MDHMIGRQGSVGSEKNYHFDRHYRSLSTCNWICFLWIDNKIGLIYIVKYFFWRCQPINLKPGRVTPCLVYLQSVYSPASWLCNTRTPFILSRDSQALECVQKFVKGLRHVPYEAALQRVRLFSLVRRRIRGDLIYMYKIIFAAPTHLGLRGHTFKIHQQRCKTRRR